MAKSINQVTLLGNLTRDPETKQLPTGLTITNFSLALNKSYKDKQDQWQEKTDYVDIVTFGKLAERVQERLSKGNRALIFGAISTSSWDDKTTGAKRTKLEIVADDVTFLDNEPQSQHNSNSKDVVLEDIDDKPIDLSEIPF